MEAIQKKKITNKCDILNNWQQKIQKKYIEITKIRKKVSNSCRKGGHRRHIGAISRPRRVPPKQARNGPKRPETARNGRFRPQFGPETPISTLRTPISTPKEAKKADFDPNSTLFYPNSASRETPRPPLSIRRIGTHLAI